MPKVDGDGNETGGYVPFKRTQAERVAAGDPRPPLEERYGTQDGYACVVRHASASAVHERFLLPADAERLTGQAAAATFLPANAAASPAAIGIAGNLCGLAKLWIGVKNSDDVGLRLDLNAEVFVNGTNTPPVVSGEVQNVSAGGSGFANAVLHTINPASASWPVSLGAGDQLLVRISARRTCTGGGGRTSGTVRLWYNGADIDGGPGRDAGSRLDAGIVGGGSNVYLRPGAALDDVPGSSRLPIDKALYSKARVRNAPSSPSGPGA